MDGARTYYSPKPCSLPECSAEDAVYDDDGDWVCRNCHESRLLDEEANADT